MEPDRRPRLDDLLHKTSRTFALTIPLLPEPLRREVTVAYLLFRIADTLEDGVNWSTDERTRALGHFADLLPEPRPAAAMRLAAEWVRRPPMAGEAPVQLLAATPFVLDCFGELRAPAQRTIAEHTRKTAGGMGAFLERARETGGLVRLTSLDALVRYCYVVAGVVGEMLTELFLLDPALEDVGVLLRARSRPFGEGLQLVNILKDAASDAENGRVYLPESLPRHEVFAMARADLESAAEYTLTLQGARAPDGLVAFNALPVRFARATLDRVEEEGAGAKISREDVWRIVQSTREAISRGQPAVTVGGPSPGGLDGSSPSVFTG